MLENVHILPWGCLCVQKCFPVEQDIPVWNTKTDFVQLMRNRDLYRFYGNEIVFFL